MKFLTIRQPWASLIAVGAKTIETRPFSTTYRGPLAIHAGKANPPYFWNLGGWTVGRLDPHEPRRMFTHDSPIIDLPLGAVVAVCDLVDVVPIVDGAGCRDGGYHCCVASWGALLHSPLHEPWPDGETEHDASDQIPFGDFTPGRYAWLLENVRPVEPVPMKGAQGLRDVPAVLAQIEGVTQ
jgi:hypothetical protein